MTTSSTRWFQLVLGIICMVMIANLQYGWTLFVNPINERYQWGLPAIQVAFSIFVLVETWLVPLEGWLVDRFGPRMVGVVSGILVALAWVINSKADSLLLLYLGAVVGGIGAGGVYGATIGNALKWFPDRRGLAAGLTAMGFGSGSALTVVPIANMIASQGYQSAFFKFGVAQGAVVFLLGWFLKAPDASFKAPPPRTRANVVAPPERNPGEMLRSPAFWVLYVMFALTAAGGLVVTAQLTPIAKDLSIAGVPVTLLGISMAALPFALSFTRILNGLSRPFFGWISDRLGRENTMFLAFTAEAVSIYFLSRYGANATSFVLLTGLVFFAYGEIYSLFPATCGDTWGRKYAAANAGVLYTAKGAASLLVPLSSIIAVSGGWHAVFMAAAVMNLLAAILALIALKPLRVRVLAR